MSCGDPCERNQSILSASAKHLVQKRYLIGVSDLLVLNQDDGTKTFGPKNSTFGNGSSYANKPVVLGTRTSVLKIIF
jgi:hypothetical protein